MAGDVLKIVTHEDVVLAKKPPLRSAEPVSGSDGEPDKLMELLGDIDGLKQEIHERMRRLEAVKQAKSLLLEDALRTEALNKRLAEFGKVMSSVNSGSVAVEDEHGNTELHRSHSRDSYPETDLCPPSGRVLNESGTLAWVRPETPSEHSVDVPEEAAQHSGIPQTGPEVDAEARAALDAALKRLEEVEQARELAWNRADEAAQEARRLLEESSSRLNQAATKEERTAAEFQAAQEALKAAYESANGRLEAAAQDRERAGKMAEEAAKAAKEAKQFLEESRTRLSTAVNKEEQARAGFLAAQEAAAAAQQGTSERLQQAEGNWRKAEQTMDEAKRLLDEATTNLNRVVSREGKAAADYESAEKALSAAYQSSIQRLEEAERFRKDADEAIAEAKKRLDQSAFQLTEANAKGDLATADLQSARQELTTAYQFASVAAQTRLDAAEFFQKAVRWAVFATAISWVAMVWAVWSAFRAHVPVFVPGILTLVIAAAAFMLSRAGIREA
jgi:hypothetical protein